MHILLLLLLLEGVFSTAGQAIESASCVSVADRVPNPLERGHPLCRKAYLSTRLTSGMANKASLKQKFLKKWVKGLQLYGSSNLTTITERRNFIKLSADVAMASVRDGATRWSRAVITNASRTSENKALVQHIYGRGAEAILGEPSMPVEGQDCRFPASVAKKITSRKILKRSRRMRKCHQPARNRSLPGSIAKMLVKKRTELLKNLVPGGESMDDVSLIKETLDYIMSLRAQVDVMQSLARMSKNLNSK